MPQTKLQPEQAVDIARKIKAGQSVKSVMLEAGYSESMAQRGKTALPKAVRDAVVALQLEASKDLIELGKQATPELVQNAVKGRLLQNVLDGEDNAVNSAKALGSWREVDMFKAETVSGVIMLAAPQVLNTARVIDAEVIECPPMPQLPEASE